MVSRLGGWLGSLWGFSKGGWGCFWYKSHTFAKALNIVTEVWIGGRWGKMRVLLDGGVDAGIGGFLMREGKRGAKVQKSPKKTRFCNIFQQCDKFHLTS